MRVVWRAIQPLSEGEGCCALRLLRANSLRRLLFLFCGGCLCALHEQPAQCSATATATTAPGSWSAFSAACGAGHSVDAHGRRLQERSVFYAAVPSVPCTSSPALSVSDAPAVLLSRHGGAAEIVCGRCWWMGGSRRPSRSHSATALVLRGSLLSQQQLAAAVDSHEPLCIYWSIRLPFLQAEPQRCFLARRTAKHAGERLQGAGRACPLLPSLLTGEAGLLCGLCLPFCGRSRHSRRIVLVVAAFERDENERMPAL